MYRVVLTNVPSEFVKVREERSFIDLYASKDYTFQRGQVGFISYGDCTYDFDREVLAVPFTIDNNIRLYYPNGFKLTGTGRLSLSIDNRKGDQLFISKGQYLATLRLMTTQFYSLVCRKDGSDKGLRSAYIKIIINNEQEIQPQF